MSWAGRNNGKITNQFTGGGNKKAGIAPTIGKGQFAIRAILYGAAGDAGHATNSIPSPANYYVSCVNQLSRVGGTAAVGGMFGSSADGVNMTMCRMNADRIRAGGPMWFPGA